MFTIDPSTGATDHVVIEGASGLARQVSGRVIARPLAAVDKASLVIRARETPPKTPTIECAEAEARPSARSPQTRRCG
jgi:phosphoenolpyruvate synthase/pyruvate phosphate dikinase